jgi:hypothetical protein
VTGTSLTAYILLDTTKPNDGAELAANRHGLTGVLSAFIEKMIVLESVNNEAARTEAETWTSLPGQLFERLRIWAAGRHTLTTPAQAEQTFLGCTDELFWSSRHLRDLRFAIRDRWDEISKEVRATIEDRLLNSPIFFPSDYEDVENRSAGYRLDALHWLSENGVNFSFDVQAEKARLRELDGRWSEESADESMEPNFGGVHSVETDTDASVILDLPLAEVLPVPKREQRFRDYTEYDPFTGYAQEKPARAVLALHSAMRRKVENTWFYWVTYLRSTADIETSPRIDATVVELVLRLSQEELARLAPYLVGWTAKRVQEMSEAQSGQFDRMVDALVDAIKSQPVKQKRIAGREWGFEAINSTAGRLTGLILQHSLRGGESSIPAGLLERLEKVLALPGDASRQSLYYVARQLPWLYHHAPDWSEKWVVARAIGHDADAFWEGFEQQPHRTEVLLRRLKPAILDRVQQKADSGNSLLSFLFTSWSGFGGSKIVSNMELRQALATCSDQARENALRLLSDAASEEARWNDLVLPFMKDVWPKQKAIRSKSMAAALFNFASRMPNLFPDIMSVVKGQLVPLDADDNLYFDGDVEELDDRAATALIEALERLLPEDRSSWPYHGKEIIGDLAKRGGGKDQRLDELLRRSSRGR